MPVPRPVRALVLARAAGRCEYCRTRGWPLTIDHVLPRVLWAAAARLGQPPPPFDQDDPSNLVGACFACNLAKGKANAGRDSATGATERLFNPRIEPWEAHLAWVNDGLEVIGTTAVGRATAGRLRLNREIYREQRRLLRAAARAGGPPWPLVLVCHADRQRAEADWEGPAHRSAPGPPARARQDRLAGGRGPVPPPWAPQRLRRRRPPAPASGPLARLGLRCRPSRARRSHGQIPWDQRYARLGRVQRLARFDDLDGTVRLVVVRTDDFDPRHRFQRDRHVRAIEIDDVERVVISGGVVYIDRFDDDDDGDHDNDADNYD